MISEGEKNSLTAWISTMAKQVSKTYKIKWKITRIQSSATRNYNDK